MKKRLALEREVQRLERTAGKELQCVCSEAIEATASSEDGLGEDGSAVEDSRRVGSSAGPSLHPPSHVRSTPCILAMLQSSNYQTLCRVVLLLLHLLQGGRHILHPRLTSAVIVASASDAMSCTILLWRRRCHSSCPLVLTLHLRMACHNLRKSLLQLRWCFLQLLLVGLGIFICRIRVFFQEARMGLAT